MKEVRNTKPELSVSLFRYFAAKDTFENYYTKFLAQRLLQRKIESWEKEEKFIALLK